MALLKDQCQASVSPHCMSTYEVRNNKTLNLTFSTRLTDEAPEVELALT